jgi:K(+)-stimulated pyrophosphate-energized sodium pump
MVLGREVVSADNFGGMAPILLPMVIAGLGVLFSIIGTFFVRINKDTDSVMNALNKGNWAPCCWWRSAAISLITGCCPRPCSSCATVCSWK